MQSHHAIKALEAYIQSMEKKKQSSTNGYEWNYIWANERILLAEEQIELYKIGKGRLNF